MHNEKNDFQVRSQGEDEATGEYPVLFDAVPEPTDSLEPVNGKTHAVMNGHDAAATHELVAAMDAVAAHDVTAERPRLPGGEEAQVSGWLADLESEIARLHDRWQQVEQGFGVKDGLINELKDDIASRDATLVELRARLEHNAESLKTLERSLAAKNEEVTNLSAEVARRAATHEQNLAALTGAAATQKLTERELEVTRAEVTRLNAAVAQERSALSALSDRNERLLSDQATLTQRIQELETYIDGRAQSWSSLKTEIAEQKSMILRLEKGLKTKDVAIDDGARSKRDLEQKLADLERQNLEVSGRRKEREAAYDELQHKLTENLALTQQLKADLAKQIADHDRLQAAAAADRTLIAALEVAVRDKDAALAVLEVQLAASRDTADERQRALERDLVERDAALAQSREQADQQSQLATNLKAELDVKRSSVDLLQRSVHRISNLGASLAELERRIESSRSARAAEEAPAPAPTVSEVPSAESEPAELLPIESFLSVDTGGSAVDRAPKLVGSVGGEAVAFALSKTEMTIGRGKTSDIRISSHFISRLHAKISTRGIATTIEDIGSKNGIFVNANRIRRCVLRDGDVVSLASELELKFVDAAH